MEIDWLIRGGALEEENRSIYPVFGLPVNTQRNTDSETLALVVACTRMKIAERVSCDRL